MVHKQTSGTPAQRADIMLSFAETVRARRSFRAFKPEPVADDLICELLLDAQQAPSNCNTQPWNMHVVSGAKRDELSRALYAANDAGRLTPDFSRDEGGFRGRYDERRREQGAIYYGNLGVTRDDHEARARAASVNFSFFGAPHVALLFMPLVGDGVRVAGDLGMYGHPDETAPANRVRMGRDDLGQSVTFHT
ncbi:nitroreductase family protein [Novosphingobium sp. BL-52-GroH]|uniref:nitroreductase family protein n=1 Tax=Novosphingobium sp. BL-52-GroH TaxID=3349877 RepID=UPI00384AA137